MIIANAQELAKYGELGLSALDSVVDILQAWKRDIHRQLISVNTVTNVVQDIVAQAKSKSQGAAAQAQASFASQPSLSLQQADPAWPITISATLPIHLSQLEADPNNSIRITTTTQPKNLTPAVTKIVSAATTDDVKTMLHQQQASRRVIFRLREETNWHNVGQPIKLRGELIELTFDFEVGTCCPEPGCFAKFGWNTPVLKVWPVTTGAAASTSAKKSVSTRKAANNTDSDDFRLICLRHAAKPLTWEEIDIG